MISLDHAREMALIETSRIQRETFKMSRRLAAAAKLVLERAGYTVRPMKVGKTVKYFAIGETPALLPERLEIDGGTVDNLDLIALLALRGFNEFGHPVGTDTVIL